MIYLDYNATAPIRPEVREAVSTTLEHVFGNASSLHAQGRQARALIETVRSQILKALGDPQGELIFTSGGTEADNLALKGAAFRWKEKGNQLIVSSLEHQAVLHPAEALQDEGFEVTQVPVDGEGLVDLEILEKSITPKTILISVMHANNEVGTIQPVEAIGKIARKNGVLFHTDAVQSFGKIPFNVRQVGADMVSISAHKLGGLKGAGALYLKQGVKIHPLFHGGPHEHSQRAGTEAVPGIVGMGAAVEASLKEMQEDRLANVARLRDRLEAGLRAKVPEVQRNGHPTQRLASTLNVSFPGCQGETLLMALDLAGICVSTGSACSSGSTEPSHVLVAMGLEASRIRGSIRFSLGWATTEKEVEEALKRIPPVVEQVRQAEASAR